MIKVALFDVDKTITRKDTFGVFLIYLVKNKIISVFSGLKCVFFAVLYLCNIVDEKRAKEECIKPLIGKTIKEIDSIAEKFWKTIYPDIFYKNAIEKIMELHKSGYKIILISASPYFYIKKFYKLKEVYHVISTVFEMKNGTFTGKIVGKNCKGEEKVERFAKYCLEKELKIDYENSVAYSDSLTDLPMFRLVAKSYLINSKKVVDKSINLEWR